MKILLFAVLLTMICTVIYAQDDILSSNGSGLILQNEVKLPAQLDLYNTGLEVITKPAFSREWQDFTTRYGTWTIIRDKITGCVNRAFGEPIRIKGFDRIDINNVKDASLEFLRENSDVLKLNTNELISTRTTETDGKYYVEYKQMYKGYEVLLSEVGLRFHMNGNLFGFSSEFYQIPDISINPNFTSEAAGKSALVNLNYNTATDNITSDGKIYILPYKTNNYIKFIPVYYYIINTEEGPGEYFAYVSIENGQLLWRQNMVMNKVTNVKASGTIKERYPSDPFVDKPFFDQYISFNGQPTTTSADGKGTKDITDDSVTINAKFTGPWASISMTGGPVNANYTKKIKSGEDFDLVWNDNNSHKFERNLFYHANWVHKFIKELDPAFSAMDFTLSVSIDFRNQSPNAYSSGKTIGFIGVNSSTMRMPESASVLYHEYGHSVNKLLYQSLGAQNGMTNSSINEGMADLFSTMIQDEPRMGVGVWTSEPDRIIRTLKNDIIYPDSLQADGHYNGQILGGAYWDLREATSLEFVRNLSHKAKYGKPDDANIGVGFSEFFWETLAADDNDGNLKNGTPNSKNIIKYFNRHRIGTSLYLLLGFKHTSAKDTNEELKNFPLEFDLTAVAIDGSKPESVKAVVTIKGETKEYTAIEYQEGKYRAIISSVPKGSLVKYYFTAYDPIGESTMSFYDGLTGNKPYDFLVGYNMVHSNAFETIKDWVPGSSQDNASKGKWENDVPNQIDLSAYGYGIIQPGKNHTPTGTKCWVTGAKGTMSSFNNYMPNGITTLNTPSFDVSSLENPVIKYFMYFYNMYLYPSPGYETYWITEISNDGGSNWKRIENTKTATSGWSKRIFVLNDIFENHATIIKMRFIFAVPYSSQYYSFNEGLIDDFEILSTNTNGMVSADENKLNESIFISNYPNPVKELTRFNLNLFTDEYISLDIYNLMGIKVSTLAKGNYQPGNYNFDWKAQDDDGNKLPAGIYLYRFGQGDRKLSGKLIVE